MHVTEQMKRDLAEDGAIAVRGLFPPERLARMRQGFDYGIDHPGPLHGYAFKGTPDEHFNDYGNPANREVHLAIVRDLGLADFVAELWGSQHVWFLGEELFVKKGGRGARSPWHQDTSYFPMVGPHMLNIWVSFEKIPRANGLEVVRGSHRGVQYNGTSYKSLKDPTDPLWLQTDWPRLPDVEADRAADPKAWDIIGFDLDVGDALILHSGSLHGGAPVTPDCPDRHTMVYRFLGDEVFYRPVPTGPSSFGYDVGELNDPSMTPGEPYRNKDYVQLR